MCVCVLSAGRIHVSESTYSRLQATQQFKLDYRGEIPVKVCRLHINHALSIYTHAVPIHSDIAVMDFKITIIDHTLVFLVYSVFSIRHLMRTWPGLASSNDDNL